MSTIGLEGTLDRTLRDLDLLLEGEGESLRVYLVEKGIPKEERDLIASRIGFLRGMLGKAKAADKVDFRRRAKPTTQPKQDSLGGRREIHVTYLPPTKRVVWTR